LVHELRKNRRRQTMRNWDGNHYINCNPRLYKGIDPAWSGKEGGGGSTSSVADRVVSVMCATHLSTL
jgi:hypothetical protein